MYTPSITAQTGRVGTACQMCSTAHCLCSPLGFYSKDQETVTQLSIHYQSWYSTHSLSSNQQNNSDNEQSTDWLCEIYVLTNCGELCVFCLVLWWCCFWFGCGEFSFVDVTEICEGCRMDVDFNDKGLLVFVFLSLRFAWQDLGSIGTTRVASVRSCP